jgi:thioredoxin-related protein
MDGTTFIDPEVVKLVRGSFVAVIVDGDSRDTLDIAGYKITERDLAKSEYQVSGYPTYWFLEADGTKLGYLRGYQSTNQLLQALKLVAERRYEKPGSKTPDGQSTGSGK